MVKNIIFPIELWICRDGIYSIRFVQEIYSVCLSQQTLLTENKRNCPI